MPPGELEREFSFIDSGKAETRIRSVWSLPSGADFLLEARLVAVQVDSGRVVAAIFSGDGDGGLFAVTAEGLYRRHRNGDLAAWAGADYELGNDRGVPMPSTLCSLWSGVDWDLYRRERPDIFKLLLGAIERGEFSVADRHHSGMFETGKTYAGGNFGHVFKLNALDLRSRSAAWVDSRARLPEFQRFYNRYVPGFANDELAASASMMGVRECRRIVGDYTLTLDDFKLRADFPDEIGRFAYCVDIHPMDESPAELNAFPDFYPNRLPCRRELRVPYRMLIPKNS